MALIKKISQITGILTRLKHFLPKYVLKTIYTSLIASHLNYCILAWGADTVSIAKAQKKAIRAISKAKYNAHSEPLFKRHNLLKVNDIRRLQELKFFFRLQNGLLPHYFQQNFISHNFSRHEYPTRTSQLLSVPRFRHEFFRQNLRYTITQTVNTTPNIVIEKTSSHSLHGYSTYAKNWILTTSSEVCVLNNCYIWGRH